MTLITGQRRIDAGELARPVKRADGSMVVQAKFSRTGVQRYKNSDGSTRLEYRPADEVGHADALDSLKLIPFTLGHPPEMVTAKNATQFSRGTTGESIKFDGKWVTGTIAVQARDAIDALAKINQISVGYDCDLDMVPGVSPEGERYDCIQRNIRGNHVALVPDARAGAEAAIRMDALASETLNDPDPKETHMDTAALTTKLTEALADVAKQTARADAATVELSAVKAELAKTAAERDTARADHLAADKARKDAVDATPERVSARVALEGNARKILGARCDAAEGTPAELDISKLADRDVQLAVIKHVTNADALVACAGKDEAYTTVYIAARYDAAVERASASADTFRAAAGVIDQHRADAGKSKVSAAREEMLKANREQPMLGSSTK